MLTDRRRSILYWDSGYARRRLGLRQNHRAKALRGRERRGRGPPVARRVIKGGSSSPDRFRGWEEVRMATGAFSSIDDCRGDVPESDPCVPRQSLRRRSGGPTSSSSWATTSATPTSAIAGTNQDSQYRQARDRGRPARGFLWLCRSARPRALIDDRPLRDAIRAPDAGHLPEPHLRPRDGRADVAAGPEEAGYKTLMVEGTSATPTENTGRRTAASTISTAMLSARWIISPASAAA